MGADHANDPHARGLSFGNEYDTPPGVAPNEYKPSSRRYRQLDSPKPQSRLFSTRKTIISLLQMTMNPHHSTMSKCHLSFFPISTLIVTATMIQSLNAIHVHFKASTTTPATLLASATARATM
jgi:hypothetical protein